eukprot:UN10512
MNLLYFAMLHNQNTSSTAAAAALCCLLLFCKLARSCSCTRYASAALIRCVGNSRITLSLRWFINTFHFIF